MEDIKNFVDVYLACRTTGADLETVIGNSTEILMDKIDIEKEIRALTAQKQFEGKIITVMFKMRRCLNEFKGNEL